MDVAAELKKAAIDLMSEKYITASMIALTFYDYLLTLDDEVRYVWKGRKTWISYLYILNRFLLMGFQLYLIFYLTNPKNTKLQCIAGYYLQVILVTLFLICSDFFIALRAYAVTSNNKIIGWYFGILIAARFATSLGTPFTRPPVYIALPPIPMIEVFNLCALDADINLVMIQISIATAIDLSAFLVIVWYAYRNRGTLKLSALIRTFVTDATLYFLVMVAAQIHIQVSMSIQQDIAQQLALLAYGLYNPILTMRFALSLKRSADPNVGGDWRSMGSTPVIFASGSSSDPRVLAVRENIEMSPVDSTDL